MAGRITGQDPEIEGTADVLLKISTVFGEIPPCGPGRR